MSIFICTDILCEIRKYVTHITDARNLSMSNKQFNTIFSPKISELHLKYAEVYTDFEFRKYLLSDSVEKFTIEKILDNYYHLLTDNYYTKTNNAMCPLLSFCGNIDLLKYALSQSCPVDYYAPICAIYNNHLDIVKYLVETVNVPFVINHLINHLIKNAIPKGDIEMFEYIKNKYPEFSKYVSSYDIDNMMKYGHTHILNWAKSNGCEFHEIHTSDSALSCGNLDVVQWAYDNDFIKNHSCFFMAAEKGHVHVLQWLIDHDFVLSKACFLKASVHGRLNVLKWAKKHNYAPDISIFNIAAFYGHVNILEWGRTINNGHNLAKSFYKDISKLYIHGTAQRNKFVVEKWAIDNNYELPITFFDEAINNNNTEIIGYALSKNYVLPDNILQLIINYDKPKMMEWLIENVKITNEMLKCINCISELLGGEDNQSLILLIKRNIITK